MGIAQAAPDISPRSMSAKMQPLGNIIENDPAMDNVYYWIGPNPTVSQGRMMINLKPFGARTANAGEVLARLKPQVAKVMGIYEKRPRAGRLRGCHDGQRTQEDRD